MAEYRLFETWTPQASYSNASEYYGLGLEFYVTAPATLTKLWYYRANTSTDDTPPAEVYAVSTGTSGTAVAGTAVSFPSSTATGWRSVALPSPVELTPNQSYRVNVYLGNTPFAYTTDPFASTGAWSAGISDGPLVAPSNADSVGQMQSPHTFKASADVLRYPDRSGTGDYYGIDVTIEDAEHGSVELTAGSALDVEGHAVAIGSTEQATGSALLLAGRTGAAEGEIGLAAGSALEAEGQAVAQGAIEFVAGSALSIAGPAAFSGPLQRVEFLALNADGSVRAPLPDVQTWVLSPLLSDAGTVRIAYPADGRNFDVLHDNVTQDRDLNIAVVVNGRVQPRLQAILSESDGDDVEPGAVWTFTGSFTEQWLSEAVVTPKAGMPSQGDDPASDQDAHFYSATAGTILRTLLQEANDRGALTQVDWSSFTNDADTEGVRWSKIITLKFSPGLTLLDVARALVEYGMCEFELDGATLRVYEGATHSVDRTTTDPPVVFRAGQQLSDSPRKHSLRDTATALLVAGGDGIYHTESDPTALAKRGRRIEAYSSQANITDAGVLQAYAEIALQGRVNGTMEKTHGLVLHDGPQPLRDYQLGDWAWSDTGDGLERLRTKHLTLTGAADGSITGTVTLNDLIAEREAALARRIQGIEGGTTVTGTSQARLRPEDLEDTTTPQAPADLAVTSLAYSEGGATFAAATATWPAPAFNTDGTAVDDLDIYVLKWRYTDTALRPAVGPGWATIITEEPEAQWSGAAAGKEIEVTVAARDRAGNYSAFSPSVFHLLAADDVAPPVPSTPVTATLFGSIRVEWDGLGSAGEEMPEDFSQVEVHASQVSGFTPDATTLYTTLSGAGVTTHSSAAYGVTVFFKLVAVDRSGNRSAPSAQASGTTRRVLEDDVFDGAIGTAKLADLAVVTAKIADLAVNNAKVADLSVGKLTAGTLSADAVLGANIATALSGPRVGLNQSGFYAYDDTRQTVSIANDGTAYFLGEVSTAVAGERISFNPGNTTPNQCRVYPDAGDLWGGFQATTWVNPLDTAIHAGVFSAFSGLENIGGNRRTWMQLMPWEASLGVADGAGAWVSRVRPQQSNVWLYTGAGGRVYLQFPNRQSWISDSNAHHNFGLSIARSASHGILFGVSDLYVHSEQTFEDFAPIWAASFNVGSSRQTKTNIRDLPPEFIAQFDNAPATIWDYQSEIDNGKHRKSHIGPMAEDLPAELITQAPDLASQTVGLSLADEIGILWEVLRLTRQQLLQRRVIDPPTPTTAPPGAQA